MYNIVCAYLKKFIIIYAYIYTHEQLSPIKKILIVYIYPF